MVDQLRLPERTGDPENRRALENWAEQLLEALKLAGYDLEDVTLGAADSGGPGFRVLLVPNA